MTSNNTATLVRQFMKKQPGITTSEAICMVTDHFNTLHWHDRNRLTEEVKRLRERLAKIETGRDQE